MVEEMLAERGICVSYETVRRWAMKFGEAFSDQIRQLAPARGDKWHLDEVVISIAGEPYWLWRAVDQNGFVQSNCVWAISFSVVFGIQGLSLIPRSGRFHTRSNSHSVAVRGGCTNIPLAAVAAQEGETILNSGFSDHSLVRFVHPDPPGLIRSWKISGTRCALVVRRTPLSLPQ